MIFICSALYLHFSPFILISPLDIISVCHVIFHLAQLSFLIILLPCWDYLLLFFLSFFFQKSEKGRYREEPLLSDSLPKCPQWVELPFRSQEPGASSMFPVLVKGPFQNLGPSFAVLPGTLAGSCIRS